MSYIVTAFEPNSPARYEWAGLVFAAVSSEYGAYLDGQDPVSLREQGIVQSDNGGYVGSRFDAEESAAVMLRLATYADERIVAMVVSLN